MNVDLIFRIAAIGIIVAVLNQLLVKSGRDEQAMLVTLAGLIVVLAVIVREVSTLFGTIKSVLPSPTVTTETFDETILSANFLMSSIVTASILARISSRFRGWPNIIV